MREDMRFNSVGKLAVAKMSSEITVLSKLRVKGDA